MNDKILIVASNYYKDVIDNLIAGSSNFLKEDNYDFDIIDAPGCFEIPFLIKKNINNYLGFIALGCIIRGETYHFELIANECARKIIDLSVDFNKPVGFGILACENYEQAILRSDPLKKNKGKEAALACTQLLNEI
jgi:6,7-dimethyl-8-ribityllumazine synthase